MKRITIDELKMMETEIPDNCWLLAEDVNMLHLLPEWEKIKNAYILGFVNGCGYKDREKKGSLIEEV